MNRAWKAIATDHSKMTRINLLEHIVYSHDQAARTLAWQPAEAHIIMHRDFDPEHCHMDLIDEQGS